MYIHSCMYFFVHVYLFFLVYFNNIFLVKNTEVNFNRWKKQVNFNMVENTGKFQICGVNTFNGREVFNICLLWTLPASACVCMNGIQTCCTRWTCRRWHLVCTTNNNDFLQSSNTQWYCLNASCTISCFVQNWKLNKITTTKTHK